LLLFIMPPPPFFPRDTVEWHLHEPDVLRRFSLSLVGMAILTGVLVRVYRLTMLAYAPLDRLWVLLAAIGGGVILLLGLVTIHLGNYPVRHWLWRAPAFAILESLAAMGVSAALIAAGVERIGTAPMHWHDWRADLVSTVVLHTAVVLVFALVLGGVVQLVRRALLKHEHREHTLEAIHEEHVKQTEEHARQTP
jgi:hypothetical protein